MDSKSTGGGILCLVGPKTFVALSWMCKQQTAVSHSNAEAEVISLDAGLRMEGIPALLLWDQILEALTDQVDVSKPSAPRNGSPDPPEDQSADSADLFRSELFMTMFIPRFAQFIHFIAGHHHGHIFTEPVANRLVARDPRLETGL